MPLGLLSQYRRDVAFGIYVTSKLDEDSALQYCELNGATHLLLYRVMLQTRYLNEDQKELQDIVDGAGKWLALRRSIDRWIQEHVPGEEL